MAELDTKSGQLGLEVQAENELCSGVTPKSCCERKPPQRASGSVCEVVIQFVRRTEWP